MPLTSVTIRGYRSVRNLTLPIEPCSVFVGANGSGKTNLYRALALLNAAADGTITREIAGEGGVNSVLWAGARRRGEPVRLVLKARFDELGREPCDGLPHAYEIEIGLPRPNDAALSLEPLIKAEKLTVRKGTRDIVMMERRGPAVNVRNETGKRENHAQAMLVSQTALSALRDAARYPELTAVRTELSDWRLYHDFRTDPGSPIRKPCHAITTPTLSADGSDLAAVLATLFVIREDTRDLDAAIADAFPGATLNAGEDGSNCDFSLTFPEFQRPFAPHELSDGTLKYLCLLGALMGYRLPALIASNEPEASLHPSLLAPLARLIARAAERTRIWVVTHSQTLADELRSAAGAQPRRVEKINGETRIAGLTLSGDYRDDDAEY